MTHVRVIGAALVIATAAIGAGCATTAEPRISTATDPALSAVAWLEGGWSRTDARGVRTEEYWTAARAGTMFGINRVISGGATVFFENLRIEAEGGTLVYHASPKGRQPATPFRLTSATPGRLVFENPEHDYPQRIIYERSSDTGLTMRIEGRSDGQERSSQWEMTRD